MSDEGTFVDALIAARMQELDAYRDRAGRVAEAHTRRIEAACAAAVTRYEQEQTSGIIALGKEQLELQVLQFAFEALQRRAVSGESVFPVAAPPAAITVQPRPAAALSAFPAARRAQTEQDAFLHTMQTALHAFQAEASAHMEKTRTALNANATQVQGLTETVRRVADELPSAFRYQGALHD